MKSIIGSHTMKFLAGLILTLSVALAHPTGDDLELPEIADNRPAKDGQFPFQVGIITNRVNEKNQSYSEWCGGALIAANVVLTAAHCVNNGVSAKVFVGAANLLELRQFEVQKEAWLIHDDYHKNDHDIALIFLPNSLSLGGNINIVNLPRRSQQDKSFENVTGLISGWCTLGDGLHLGLQLQYAYRLILPNASCEKAYGDNFHSDLQVCVNRANGTSPYAGDSGGPLSVSEKDGSRTVVGVSCYAKPLYDKGLPTVYTRVTSHLDWIHEKAGVPIRE